jgi:hypothetical protein
MVAMANENANADAAANRPPCECTRIGSGAPNRRIRCEWNEAEQRYNLNCREVDVSECQGCA